MTLHDAIKGYLYTVTLNELKLMNHSFLEPDMSYNTLLYLDLISLVPQCTASHLAELLGISRAGVAIKINEMSAAGLITKEQSEKDKRVYFLAVNEKMAGSYQAYDRGLAVAIKKVREEYSREEIQCFTAILSQLTRTYTEQMDLVKENE